MKRSMAILALLALPLAGCTAAHSPAPTPSMPTAELDAPVDPYVDLQHDPEQRTTIEGVAPVLRAAGTGPTTFTLRDLPADAVEIRYFVSCAPASDFTLTARLWFSGPCDRHWANSGSVPRHGATSVRVRVDLPEGARFRILALPVPREKVIQ